MFKVQVLPVGVELTARQGENLLALLRRGGCAPDAPCGGNGTCGKCRVLADGAWVSACATAVDRDMTVELPRQTESVLCDGVREEPAATMPGEGFALAFDIGTTTLAAALLEAKTGTVLAQAGAANPQSAYGADVISRIRHALAGEAAAMTAAVRQALTALAGKLCADAGVSPAAVEVVSAVGNPAMQQLFLGMDVGNLARLPFAPVLTRAQCVEAGQVLPVCANATLLIVPNIAGFVGADTVAGILATDMDSREELTLLVDIGTNGEMVLGNREGLAACATAAGPALEGANIRFGMRAREGAVDHVRTEKGALRCSVLGDTAARGICGSGLVDAVAAALEAGWINNRGKILTESGVIELCDGIYLEQEDIRQVQLAKGAIAAGIELLCADRGIAPEQISRVLLAGAFGTYMDGASACRIGLLPPALKDKIRPVGNAALQGSILLARHEQLRQRAQALCGSVRHLELASLPGFARSFARNMRF